MKKFFITFVALSFLLFGSASFAHGLNVFAWLENDSILVQCDYGQKRPAQHAAIAVYDSSDKQELAHGFTDTQGRYVFPVPDVVRRGHGLLVVADAGQGHRGEWAMDASELYAAASLTAGFDAAALQGNSAQQVTPQAGVPLAHGPVTQEQVRNIIQEALELKLSPIRKEIAAQSASGPTLTEIIGGIGWIIGLVGIALYFKSRKA